MMDFLGWIGWLLWSLLALLWSLVWLLLGGWVSTALQILVVILAVYVYRYGWRRAPGEVVRQALAVGRFASGAMKATEALAQAETDRKREVSRAAKRTVASKPLTIRNRGDVTVNLSTLLSVAMLAGLWIISAL
jgi:hypothetical protein